VRVTRGRRGTPWRGPGAHYHATPRLRNLDAELAFWTLVVNFDPDQPRDPDGKWGAGEEEWIKKGEAAWRRTSLKDWSDEELSSLDKIAKASKGTNDTKPGDKALEEIARIQGFDKAPKKGDTADGVRIHRGMHFPGADKYAEGFLDGTAKRQGLGTFGNGHYFATDRNEAEHYGDVLIDGVLPSGLKIVDYDELKKEWQQEYIATLNKPGFAAISDIGRYAAMKGYDAISTRLYSGDKPDTYIVLNRGAMVVAP